VATGHVIGDRNIIIGMPSYHIVFMKADPWEGKLVLVVDKGKSVAATMEMHAARLDKLDEIMKSLADRIRVTSSILGDIQDLVRSTVEKNVRLSLKHPAVISLFADVKNCETTFQSTEKILETIKEDAGKSIVTEGRREKIELTPDKIRELTGRFKWIGMEIQDRKINLQIRLWMFQQSIKPTKQVLHARSNELLADFL
jgi:regulator of replication initiation timing